jgi:hypothetical protein
VVGDKEREPEMSKVELEKRLDTLRCELEKAERLAEQLRTLAMRARKERKEN